MLNSWLQKHNLRRWDFHQIPIASPSWLVICPIAFPNCINHYQHLSTIIYHYIYHYQPLSTHMVMAKRNKGSVLRMNKAYDSPWSPCGNLTYQWKIALYIFIAYFTIIYLLNYQSWWCYIVICSIVDYQKGT